MSITTCIDIETIPDQREGALERFIENARSNFHAPAGMTKGQLGADLGLTDKQIKFTPASDLKAQWEEVMGPVKFAEIGEQNWRKTALDGSYGQIFCIGWSGLSGGERVVFRHPGCCEATFLRRAFEEIHNDERVPLFAGHNVIFDLQFLWRRAVVLGVKPPFKLPFSGRHGKDYWCNSQAWTGSYAKRISQDELCGILGVTQKPEGINGANVWDHVRDEEYQRVVEYCKYDVRTVRRIFDLINFMGEGHE